MKCPKCGYNSFEIHDTCKKCANDLTGYKETHGLKSIVLPREARASMAEKLMANMAQDDHAVVADVPADMFSFDIPEDVAAANGYAAPKDDPFSFDDLPASPTTGNGEFAFGTEQKSAQAKAEEDAFADLLEPTTQPQQPAAAAEAGTQEASDLNSFSWDDTPDAAPGDTAKPDDDFNNLFGDTDEDAKK